MRWPIVEEIGEQQVEEHRAGRIRGEAIVESDAMVVVRVAMLVPESKRAKLIPALEEVASHEPVASEGSQPLGGDGIVREA
jgi:hypothetical protein